MPRPALLALAVLLLVPSVYAADDAPKKKLYCWDDHGHKVCGDALPATAVNSARTEIDAKNGMATARVNRALTPDEQAAAAAQDAAQAQTAAAMEAEHRRLMAMVASFATEADLRKAFATRVELNQDSIKTARMGMDGLRQSLVGLLRRAGEAELGSKPVPKKIVTDIQAQHAQLLRQQSQLVSLQRDGQTIRAQLDEAVTRYRELKPQAAAVATTGSPTG